MQQLQKTAAASHNCGQAWIDKSHVNLIQKALCSQDKYMIGFRQCPCRRNGCTLIGQFTNKIAPIGLVAFLLGYWLCEYFGRVVTQT